MTRRQKTITAAIALLALELLVVLAPSIPFPFIPNLSIFDLAGGAFSGGAWPADRVIIVGSIVGFALGFGLAIAQNRRAAVVGITLEIVGLVTLIIWIFQMFFVVKTTAA